MIHDVVTAEYLDGYRLKVTFGDGRVGRTVTELNGGGGAGRREVVIPTVNWTHPEEREAADEKIGLAESVREGQLDLFGGDGAESERKIE